MPIEKTFSYIKYYLKDHDESMDAPTVVVQAVIN